MLETFTAILTAHLLGDFVFQPEWTIKHNRKPRDLFLHAMIAALASCLLLGTPHPYVLVSIVFACLVIGAI